MTAVAGTSNRRALGSDPEIERLARLVRKQGGSVTVTRSNHLVWELPDGTCIRSGLTMSRGRIRNLVRDLRRALGVA